MHIVLDIKLRVGALKKTFFPDCIGCCHFEGEFQSNFLQDESDMK